MRRKKKKIKKSNKEFLVIMYLFLAVFLSMMIYFVYFQVCKSESFINSHKNNETEVIMCVMRKATLVKVRNLLKEVDPCISMFIIHMRNNNVFALFIQLI